MIADEYLGRSRLFQRLKNGPHGQLVEHYAVRLVKEGLVRNGTWRCLNLVGDLLSWMASSRSELTDLDERMVERYLRYRGDKGSIQRGPSSVVTGRHEATAIGSQDSSQACNLPPGHAGRLFCVPGMVSSPPVKPVRVAMLSRARPICGPPRTTAAISSSRRPAGPARANPCHAGVGVDVDQAWGNDLAARIDRFRGVARDVGLDRCDLSRGDRQVADRVKPDRGIDHAPA
jgi:hypothetical protein